VRQWSPTASWIVLGLIELARVNHIEAVVYETSITRREPSSDVEDVTIVNAVINMARSLHRRAVAEGVETLEQLNFLQQRRFLPIGEC
jgi:hypothetical protein